MAGRDAGPVIGIVGLGAGVFGYVGPQMLGMLRDWSGGFNAGWYFLALAATVTLVEIIVLHRFARSSRNPAMISSAATITVRT